MNEIENLINGQDSITQAGISMNAEPLGKRKLKFQIYTLQIPFELVRSTNDGSVIGVVHHRVQFETTAHKTNDRIVGITLHSNFEEALNESTIQFSLDSEEVFPSGFDCSLIASKRDVGFYKNMYRVNERANGALIKGEYGDNCLIEDVVEWIKKHPEAQRDSSEDNWQYTVKIYLWSIQKPLNQNIKGL